MSAAERLDLTTFVRPSADNGSRLDLAVEGINCGGCIGKIERALNALPGVVRARVNFSTRRLTVEWSNGTLDPARIVSELARKGYRAYPFKHDRTEEEEGAHGRWLLRCLAVAGFAAMNVMLLSVSIWAGAVSDITPATRDLFHWVSALVVLPAAAFAGQPFFRSAVSALRTRSLNMDVPISLGIILALGMSLVETANHAEHAYYDSAIMLIFFLLIGRWLDHAVRRRTRASAANLAALRAPVASRIGANGVTTTVPAQALRIGDQVMVHPGDRMPVDGRIMSGSSDIDESLVTGETAPRAVAAGDLVYAGTLNSHGSLRIEVRAAAGATLLDEIERLITAASVGKSRYRRLADRVARLYAPIVHLTAACTAIGWFIAGATLHDALVTAIAVLIITCPCALALAVPAVQVVASGVLFRIGILLNAGDAIERLANVDTVVFDKTGTLTLPEPGIVNAATIAPATLEVAGRLALSSRHPLARPIAVHAADETPFDGVREIRGEGTIATIDGREARLGSPAFCDLEADAALLRASAPDASVVAFRHGDRTAVFLLRQTLRTDAMATVRALRGYGLAVTVLSGSRAHAVAPVAGALGISDWRGDMKPPDKIARLAELQSQGRKTLMVGDGLNDAPALAAAHASVSLIEAADLTQACADAVFVGAKLAPVAEAIAVSRSAFAIMKQNLGLAVVYNLIAMPLAISGHVTPLVAAAAMSLSSVIVTVNALRAGKRPHWPDGRASAASLNVQSLSAGAR